MANGYTEHYGLCQWAAEDSFLREEFNQDNAKIDGALNTLSEELSEAQEENEEKLDPIRYNLYQLWLQRYYEGKETGMKKALLFDGFLDGSLVAALTQGTFLHGGSVWLSGTGQDSITGQTQTGGIAAQGGTVESDVVTADGYGYLTGCTLEESYLGASASAVVTVTVEFLLNGKVQAARQVTMRGSESVFSISAGKSIPVCPGDTFQMKLTAPENDWLRFTRSAANGNHVAAGFAFTSGAAASGTLTSTAFAVDGTIQKARLYLRRRGGSASPSLNGTAMTWLSARETVDGDGSACQEDSWELSGIQSPLTVKLALDRGSDGTMEVLDYGMVLL